MQTPGLSYQLSFLEQLLTETIPAWCREETNKTLLTDKVLAALNSEAKRLNKSITEAAYQCEREHTLCLYIEHHQKGLTRLADTLDKSIFDPAIQLLCINCIDSIFAHLQYDFTNYFNEGVALPAYKIKVYTHTIKAQLLSLQKILNEKNIDPNLLSILLVAFEEYLLPANRNNSRQYQYLQMLYEAMMCVKDEAECIPILYKLNFNSPAFLLYEQETIAKKMQACKSETAKIIWLTQCKKRITGYYVRKHIALHPFEGTVQEMMLDWINEEKQAAENKWNNISLPPTKKSAYTFSNNQPIDTALSAPEMALLAKLLLEKGLFPKLTRPFLLKQIAKHFNSKGTRNRGLSWESLNSKYSSIEQSTVNSIRDLLIDMINHLRKIERELK